MDKSLSKSTWGEQPVEDIPNFTLFIYLCHASCQTKIDRDLKFGTHTGCLKKVTIGLPKPQFFNETFEIFVVGRLFHSGFSAFSDLKIFNFTGPKSKFENFKNSQKIGDSFFIFSSQFFW